VRALFADLWYCLPRLGRLRRLPPDFRERLMLVVTAVNACRFCAAFHSGLAVRAGVRPEEARALLADSLPVRVVVPDRELPALLHARAWAERDGAANTEAEGELRRRYGPRVAEAIQVAMRTIRVGNLVGNTLDAALARITARRVRRR
jgi:AhpD family alkylhydroperoxidase